MPPIAQNYVPVVKPLSPNADFTASALVGVNSLILGWSASDQIDRKKLLGFGIRRTDYDSATGNEIRKEWFYGNKRFKFQVNQGFGATIPSYLAPFQRFSWNDYTLDPGKSYKYEIVPLLNNPENPDRADPIELLVKPSANQVGNFGIYTNRGVTAAHAYLDRFKANPNPKNNIDAQLWLSRGLKESLLKFIGHAQAGDGLHIAIYEFEDTAVAKALEVAKNKGVDVHIVYHAKDPKQKKSNEHMLKTVHLEDAGHSTARDKIINISHNKFVVLLKQGSPKAVWTGTCNFTFNAFYLQTNMALEVNHAKTADAYEAYFNILKKNEDVSGKANPVKKEIESLINQTEVLLNQENWEVKFSPVSKVHLIDICRDIIKNAQSAVFFSAPFALDPNLVEALGQNSPDVIEYGLCNATVKKKITNLNLKNTRFFTPSALKTYMGQKWDAQAFGSHKIHSKTLVADPWGDHPKVIIGTANFSDESCRENDENFLLIEGDKRLAAIVTTEFIRMWEHYKNRAFINEMIESSGQAAIKELLSEDGSWSSTAYNKNSKSYKFRERVVFSGGL